MTCGEAREQLALACREGRSPELEAHLAQCPSCAAEQAALEDTWAALQQLVPEAPAPALRARVVRRTHPLGWSLAAASLLAAGFGAGWLLRPVPPLDPVQAQRAQVLRLLRGATLGERATGLALVGATEAGPELLDALLERVAKDPAPGLRQEAADALALFADRPGLRERVVAMLAQERDPQVQLALVDLLGACREQAARRALKRLLEAGTLQEPARARAQQLL